MLLKDTLPLSILSLNQWSSKTMLAAFWLLFRVDASATSLASLGSQQAEISQHLQEAFSERIFAALLPGILG